MFEADLSPKNKNNGQRCLFGKKNSGYMAMVASMNGEVVLLGGGIFGIILKAFHLLNVALVANLLC